MQFAFASVLVQTTTHHPGTTHQPQWDFAPTCCYQGFLGSWQFFLESCRASHHASKHSLSPTICLNHTVIQKYLINTQLYINFSKYINELLVIHIFQHSLTPFYITDYANLHKPCWTEDWFVKLFSVRVMEISRNEILL